MQPSTNMISNFVAELNNTFFVIFIYIYIYIYIYICIYIYLMVVTILCIRKEIFTLRSRVDYCTDQKRNVVLQLEQKHFTAVCKRCSGAVV